MNWYDLTALNAGAITHAPINRAAYIVPRPPIACAVAAFSGG